MYVSPLIENANERLIAEAEELTNSLSCLSDTLMGPGTYGPGQQLSQTDTIFDNLRWYLISNQRQLLSQIYVEHGIISTLVDQPVDDAFATGFEIKTSQLSKDEIESLKVYLESNHVIENVKEGIKWARLYGGGAIIICTDQDYTRPLNVAAIKQNSPLEFRAADMWELFYSQQNVAGDMFPGNKLGENMGDYYDYYGLPVHKSRVLRIVGKTAPSFIRPRLRGWGLSAVEPMVRSLNSYLKNQDVVFALLDEAKVDVYGIEGYNSAMLQRGGTQKITNQIQMTNRIKNYANAIIRDKKDEYTQKQMSFSGLADILTQIRQNIAGDLKMPMSKLFGISAAGFNSGEDDIENYNSMLNGEIRSKTKFTVLHVLQLSCQRLFGMIPDDLMIEFNPLRILNAKEEEEVKDSQFNRVMSATQSGLIEPQEAKMAINKDSLLGIEIDENTGLLPPIAGDFTVKSATGSAGKKTPSED